MVQLSPEDRIKVPFKHLKQGAPASGERGAVSGGSPLQAWASLGVGMFFLNQGKTRLCNFTHSAVLGLANPPPALKTVAISSKSSSLYIFPVPSTNPHFTVESAL